MQRKNKPRVRLLPKRKSAILGHFLARKSKSFKSPFLLSRFPGSNSTNYGWIGCDSLLASKDFLHTFSMALYHKWNVKNGFAYVLTFFSLISDGLGSVSFDLVFCWNKSSFQYTFSCLDSDSESEYRWKNYPQEALNWLENQNGDGEESNIRRTKGKVQIGILRRPQNLKKSST